MTWLNLAEILRIQIKLIVVFRYRVRFMVKQLTFHSIHLTFWYEIIIRAEIKLAFV